MPEGFGKGTVQQPVVNIESADAYAEFVVGHDAAVCTLGVGQPSQMTKAQFVHIDKGVVIAFAKICKQSGVPHFELLGAVGAEAKSRAFYLRVKGELEETLVALNFERLSLFQPSMILTPTNQYGIQQALMLAFWPGLSRVLIGPTRKYRSIRIEALRAAMASNLATAGQGVETLHWDQFTALAEASGG